jgi:hypothetical protein
VLSTKKTKRHERKTNKEQMQSTKVSKHKKMFSKWVTLMHVYKRKDDRQISCWKVMIKEQRKPKGIKKTNEGKKLKQLTSLI